MYYHISLTELKTKNIVSHLRGGIGSEVEVSIVVRMNFEDDILLCLFIVYMWF